MDTPTVLFDRGVPEGLWKDVRGRGVLSNKVLAGRL
jgi:hypothetical protein